MSNFNDQVKYWAHMLDESTHDDQLNEIVEPLNDGYYMRTTNPGKLVTVEQVLEAIDNLPEGAYENPVLASSVPGKIFGYVNGITLQTAPKGKTYVQFTVAPYKNGTHQGDFSTGEGDDPIRAQDARQILQKFPMTKPVLIKQKDIETRRDVMLYSINEILASRSDGVFLRIYAPVEKLVDNAKKDIDFAQRIADMMKHSND